MADLTIKQGDLFPALVTTLYDVTLGEPGVPVDLTTATSITMFMKGTSTLLTAVMSKLTVVTPTATTSLGSSVLTGVSSFTNIVKGGSLQDLVHGGIPAGAVVGTFSASAQTITMVTLNSGVATPALATASNTGITLTVNQGGVTYQWVSGDTAAVGNAQAEFEVVWPTSLPQTFPNGTYRSVNIVASLDGS